MSDRLGSDQIFNIVITAIIVFGTVLFVGAMWVGTNINDKIRYGTHYSAYEICINSLSISDRPHDLSQCRGLDNSRK